MNKLAAEQWRQIFELLDTVLELPSEQRAAWVDALDESRSALKPALRELLARRASLETGDFLNGLPQFTRVEAGPAPVGVEPSAGHQVGPYCLVRQLGRGGMGTVWLAERSDGAFQRRVALKLPHVGWSGALAERMARERDILASLEHQNIARFYDAGVDQLGRPYIAMEYVEGQPIDSYCRERALGLRESLVLMLDVIKAVAHAHTRLVVHRDLKPGNILVSADGSAHLLDFGVAKLLDSAADPVHTQFAGRALTPDYAAPEQIKGEPVSTATDIYSLAVVCYELLAGARPYKLKVRSAAQLEAAIAEVDPLLASEATTDPARRRQLRGDLDAILNQAMKKDPHARYATVAAFGDDLQRYLRGQPVLARPDTFLYRTHKFAARNRAAVVASVAVAIALIAAAAVSTWQARTAAQQRNRALTLLAQNNAVSDFVDRMLTEVASPGEPITVDTLVERGEALASSASQNSPEHQAAILLMLADYYAAFDHPDKAEALLQRALDLTSNSSDVGLRAELICEQAGESGARDPAASQRAIQAALRMPGLPDDAAANCSRQSGHVYLLTGAAQEALQVETVALQKLRVTQPANPLLEAIMLSDIASAQQLSGDPAAADRSFAAALDKFAEIGRAEHPMVTNLWNAWANADDATGDFVGALDKYEHALGNATKHAVGGQPPIVLVFNYARMLAQLGRLDAALSLYERDLPRAEQAGSRKTMVNGLLGKTRVLLALGQTQAAQAAFDTAAAEIGTNVARETPEGIGAYAVEAKLAAAHGDLSHAVEAYTHAVDFFERRQLKIGALAAALYGRGEVHLLAGDTQAALADAQRALEISRTLQGQKHASAHTGLSLALLSRIQDSGGNKVEGERLAREAAAQLREALGPEHPETKRMLARI
jgi:eukaryotic-like serine/threonine-protein kinase